MAFSAGYNGLIYVAGYDISGDCKSLDAEITVDLGDTTTFGKTQRTRIALLSDGSLSLGGFLNATTGQSSPVLSGIIGSNDSIYQAYWAGDAVGAHGIGFAADQDSLGTSTPFDGVVEFTATSKPSSGVDFIRSIHALGSETASGTGTTLDNSASTTVGGSGYLTVTSWNATTLDVSIRHSSDNFASDDTELLAFTQVSGANSAERVTATGTVKRYVRAIWTLVGTSASFSVAIGRDNR